MLWKFMLASTVVSCDGVLCEGSRSICPTGTPLQTVGRFYSYL